jgi:hypothetical protein
MKLFDSELQYLSELYQRLEQQLARTGTGAPREDGDSLIRVLGENRELFSRIDQMNGRVQQMVGEWEKFRDHLDPQYRTQTQKLAAAVAQQGANLNRLLGERASRVEQIRFRLASELGELGRGSRYLQSVKPLKTNYPKFIDSLG